MGSAQRENWQRKYYAVAKHVDSGAGLWGPKPGFVTFLLCDLRLLNLSLPKKGMIIVLTHRGV